MVCPKTNSHIIFEFEFRSNIFEGAAEVLASIDSIYPKLLLNS
jgi:hypothetical protein